MGLELWYSSRNSSNTSLATPAKPSSVSHYDCHALELCDIDSERTFVLIKQRLATNQYLEATKLIAFLNQ